MRILHITPYFEPAFSYGGVVTVVSSISKKQLEQGNEVTVVTTDVFNRNTRYKPSSSPTNLKGITVYYFKNLSNYLANRFNLYTGSCRYAIWLFNGIKKYDVVHLHSVFNPFSIFSLLVCKLKGIRPVITPHGSLLLDRIKYRKGIKSILVKLIRSLSSSFRAIHALTQVEKKNLVSLGFKSEKITVIPNGVDAEDFLSHELTLRDKNKVISDYNLNPESPTVLFLARIHKIKGAHLLIEASKYLVDKFPGINIIIAGPDDGYLGECIRLAQEPKISNNIKLIGPISGSAKVNLLKYADVFCLPSEAEGFSMVVLEAAVSGCALVLSYGCNFPEIVNYNSGLLTSLEPKSIAKSIVEAISKKDFYGKHAIEMVIKDYTWNSITQNIMSIYK
ncbi:glycosyltransferase [Candidatus Dojkabacteria bacterium]|nr:glycosyltransferase [Candidatus Dojkabacteria bacterium]